MRKAARSYKMYLPHESTTRIYSSAVLVAILLLATPEEYLCYNYGTPASYTYGWPKFGDFRMSRHIELAPSSWGSAMYKTTLEMRWQINCVKFTDNLRNGPKIWISQWPPCYNPDIAITSRAYEKIDVTMEVYYTRP